MNKKIVIVIFTYLACIPNINLAKHQNTICPYDAIRYHEAFNQEILYKKYEKLMRQLRCAENVFLETEDSFRSLKKFNITDSFDDQIHIIKELEQFQNDCLAQLNYIRCMALAEPAIESGMYVSLIAVAALITMWTMGKNSTGGSYSGYSAIFGAAYELSGIGKSLYNLWHLPNNSLEGLENYFAKNKCFIPKILWSKIINAFIDARQSDTLKEKNINFLKFTLGFTLYRPYTKSLVSTCQPLLEIKHELYRRIDEFFAGYNKTNHLDDIAYIKINISKFIDSLLDQKNKRPRYVYLHGLGGIGKTHFVQTLAAWIEELLPNVVHYQDLIVNSMHELEGDSDKPGTFLKVLRNQIMNNKIGSIIMLDEATWLNDSSMVSAAKRIFNGDRTRLSTAYFGSDIDGSAVTLDVPPMLIFVASNDELVDIALASRFDIVHYPTPTKKTLADYAYRIVQSSVLLAEADYSPIYEDIVAWIDTIDFKNLNFRYIAGNVEAYCLNFVSSFIQ